MAESEVARLLREARAKRQALNANRIENWVEANFDDIARERSNKTQWEDIASVATGLGVKNMRGNENPTGAVVRKYFLRASQARKGG